MSLAQEVSSTSSDLPFGKILSVENAINFTLANSLEQNSTENSSYYYDYKYNTEYDPYKEYELAIGVNEFLSHYYTPTIVVFGSVGNILSVVVFFKTKLRKLSSSYYLAALGLSDTVFLLIAFVTWLNFLNINIYNKPGYCEMFTYLSGLCSFLSVWFVVAFTIERYIAVLYPLKRQSMCTVKRACSVLICLVIFGSFINIPYYKYASPVFSEVMQDYICDIKEDHKVRSLKCLPEDVFSHFSSSNSIIFYMKMI